MGLTREYALSGLVATTKVCGATLFAISLRRTRPAVRRKASAASRATPTAAQRHMRLDDRPVFTSLPLDGATILNVRSLRGKSALVQTASGRMSPYASWRRHVSAIQAGMPLSAEPSPDSRAGI